MEYLDANVFLYAILYEGDKADGAIEILEEVAAGYRKAATSTLTIDEIVWILMKKSDREKAIEAGTHVQEMSSLKLLPVTEETTKKALILLENHSLIRPRDAIHAAAALQEGLHTIVSDDARFDQVTGLRRVGLDRPEAS